MNNLKPKERMKKLLFLMLFSILLVSCDNSLPKYNMAVKQYNEEDYENALKSLSFVKTKDEIISEKADSLKNLILKEQKLMTYEGMKENRNDTTFLNFILGSSEKEVNKHISELLKQNKIKDKTSYTFTLGYGEYAQRVKLSGYEIDFYPADYSCKGLIQLKYFNENLSSVEITLFNAPEGKSVVFDVDKMYTKKYGATRKYSSFYNNEESKYFYHFWRESNKAIYISKISSFVTINYDDLIAKHEKETLIKELENIKKEDSSQKSEETQKDI